MLPLLLSLTLLQPVFEIASVKPVKLQTDSYMINLGRTNHGELTRGNATLADCLKFAYSLNDNIQLSGPEWINRKGEVIFDITGKADPATTREQLKLMLRTLLTERFQMTLHREQRQASYLALTQSKKGLRMEETDPALPGNIDNVFHLGHIDSKGVYLSVLATVLSRFMHQPVLDMTGLEGRYVVKLEWSAETMEASSESNKPSIYSALQDQVGLKLESRKGPIEVLVIDSAVQSPLAN